MICGELLNPTSLVLIIIIYSHDNALLFEHDSKNELAEGYRHTAIISVGTRPLNVSEGILRTSEHLESLITKKILKSEYFLILWSIFDFDEAKQFKKFSA